MPYFSINGSERGLRANDSNPSQSKEKGRFARAVGFEAIVEFQKLAFGVSSYGHFVIRQFLKSPIPM